MKDPRLILLASFSVTLLVIIFRGHIRTRSENARHFHEWEKISNGKNPLSSTSASADDQDGNPEA
jgi:hypothetical protein